jgi:hypothetical protein
MLISSIESTLHGSIPNSLLNSLPNALPNALPNSLSNSLPNALPNSLPNALPNFLPKSLPNSISNSLPTSLPNFLHASVERITHVKQCFLHGFLPSFELLHVQGSNLIPTESLPIYLLRAYLPNKRSSRYRTIFQPLKSLQTILGQSIEQLNSPSNEKWT